MMQLNKREGLNCKVGVRCFSWPMVACHGEGEVEIFGGDILVEENGSVWKCVEVRKLELLENDI